MVARSVVTQLSDSGQALHGPHLERLDEAPASPIRGERDPAPSRGTINTSVVDMPSYPGHRPRGARHGTSGVHHDGGSAPHWTPLAGLGDVTVSSHLDSIATSS
jgi:hypothetical protein